MKRNIIYIAMSLNAINAPLAKADSSNCLVSPKQAHCITQSLKIYAGPQTVAPGEPIYICLLYTSPSPRDQRGSRMPSSA